MADSVVELWCDGSGEERVNRPGGWAFVALRGDEVLLSRSGGSGSTTSLLMELEAVRASLEAAHDAGWERVCVVSDCRVALDVVTGAFLPRPASVRPLALDVRALAQRAAASTRWVRGHGGHSWNEHVDGLARVAKQAAAARARRRAAARAR
jgi:ribonuclease HI